jgi:hypothetical protein
MDSDERQVEVVAPGPILRGDLRREQWSQRELIHEVEVVAARRGLSLATVKSLKSQVSRWEPGHRVPDRPLRSRHRLPAIPRGASSRADGEPIDLLRGSARPGGIS